MGKGAGAGKGRKVGEEERKRRTGDGRNRGVKVEIVEEGAGTRGRKWLEHRIGMVKLERVRRKGRQGREFKE